jgi:hypothetical protein
VVSGLAGAGRDRPVEGGGGGGKGDWERKRPSKERWLDMRRRYFRLINPRLWFPKRRGVSRGAILIMR